MPIYQLVQCSVLRLVRLSITAGSAFGFLCARVFFLILLVEYEKFKKYPRIGLGELSTISGSKVSVAKRGAKKKKKKRKKKKEEKKVILVTSWVRTGDPQGSTRPLGRSNRSL